jgi:hypothetical protein|tara:strand:+ start:4101 stop:4280 length:180 start_codon:yes stop_codon:yes gene_type:complete
MRMRCLFGKEEKRKRNRLTDCAYEGVSETAKAPRFDDVGWPSPFGWKSVPKARHVGIVV